MFKKLKTFAILLATSLLFNPVSADPGSISDPTVIDTPSKLMENTFFQKIFSTGSGILKTLLTIFGVGVAIYGGIKAFMSMTQMKMTDNPQEQEKFKKSMINNLIVAAIGILAGVIVPFILSIFGITI